MYKKYFKILYLINSNIVKDYIFEYYQQYVYRQSNIDFSKWHFAISTLIRVILY